MASVFTYKTNILSSYDVFLDTLSQVDIVLTPTQRLSKQLNQSLADYQKKKGLKVWHTQILSLSGFMDALWQDCQENTVLRLNDWQDRLLWLSIIDANTDFPLLRKNATAQLAQQAWQLLQQWQIDYRSLENQVLSADQRAFISWCAEYQALCQDKKWCDSSLVPHYLLSQQIPFIAKKIYLVGFTDITPSVQALLLHLEKNDAKILGLEYQIEQQSVHMASFADAKTEIEQAALWAKSQAGKKIGIVFGDLSMRWHEIDAVFSHYLMPESDFAHHYDKPRPYNISSGQKLAQFPIVKKAFDALFSVKEQGLRLPSAWVFVMLQVVSNSEFLKERRLNSIEYQVIVRLYELINQFSTLDIVQDAISYQKACHLLQDATEQDIFQGESEDKLIQILGHLEASGLYFDALWIAGLSNDNWPLRATPQPFLPLSLQRMHLMPHASAERELEYASNLTKRFTTQATEVILSYPKQENDKTLMPSGLIIQYPEKPIHFEQDPILQSSLESWTEQSIPLRNQQLSGGAGLLQSQAACPFQAFARYRLHANPLPVVQKGLNHAERGQIIHEALAHFWQQIQTSKQLHGEHIHQAIHNAVNAALSSVTLAEQLLSLEKNRLIQLLMDWIEVERKRLPFTVIAHEKNVVLHIEGLQLKGRVDRIDQMDSGEIILIDYKTGHLNYPDWLHPHHQHLQLPLYALHIQGTAGVAFAKVKKNAMAWMEINAHQLNDYSITWPELLLQWQQQLQKIAKDFIAGQPYVAPVEGEQTCRHCHLSLLCRLRSAS